MTRIVQSMPRIILPLLAVALLHDTDLQHHRLAMPLFVQAENSDLKVDGGSVWIESGESNPNVLALDFFPDLALQLGDSHYFLAGYGDERGLDGSSDVYVAILEQEDGRLFLRSSRSWPREVLVRITPRVTAQPAINFICVSPSHSHLLLSLFNTSDADPRAEWLIWQPGVDLDDIEVLYPEVPPTNAGEFVKELGAGILSLKEELVVSAWLVSKNRGSFRTNDIIIAMYNMNGERLWYHRETNWFPSIENGRSAFLVNRPGRSLMSTPTTFGRTVRFTSGAKSITVTLDKYVDVKDIPEGQVAIELEDGVFSPRVQN